MVLSPLCDSAFALLFIYFNYIYWVTLVDNIL